MKRREVWGNNSEGVNKTGKTLDDNRKTVEGKRMSVKEEEQFKNVS